MPLMLIIYLICGLLALAVLVLFGYQPKAHGWRLAAAVLLGWPLFLSSSAVSYHP